MSVLNGTRLPNWFWLVVGMVGVGFQAGIIWSSSTITKADIKEQAARYELRDIERTAALKRDIESLDQKLDRRTNRINEELSYIGAVTRYVARKVE